MLEDTKGNLTKFHSEKKRIGRRADLGHRAFVEEVLKDQPRPITTRIRKLEDILRSIVSSGGRHGSSFVYLRVLGEVLSGALGIQVCLFFKCLMTKNGK